MVRFGVAAAGGASCDVHWSMQCLRQVAKQPPGPSSTVDGARVHLSAHVCTQPKRQSCLVGAVEVAQSRPAKPAAQAQLPLKQKPLPEQPSRQVRASQK